MIPGAENLASFLPASSSLDAARVPDARAMRETADSFESMFLYMLLEPLEKAQESMMGDGPESRTFGQLFRQNMADTMASSRPLGIARQVEAAIQRQQQAFESAAARQAYGATTPVQAVPTSETKSNGVTP